jgi:O-antigen/teichoic acid export membrane protein
MKTSSLKHGSPHQTALETRARSTRSSFSWAFVGQAFSSAANLALAIVAGRLLGPAGLGVVVIGYAAYQLVAALVRAVVTQPLIAHAAPLPHLERLWLAKSGLTIVAASGLLASLVLAAVGLTVGGSVGHGLLLFAPWVLAGLLQEFWKAILFQEGRSAVGGATDIARFITFAMTLPLALTWKHDYIVVGGWGLGAAAGFALGIASFPNRPEPLRASVGACVGIRTMARGS